MQNGWADGELRSPENGRSLFYEAPDLLTDVVLSLANEIDAKQTAELTNELLEAVRKLHTGSALLGETSRTKFEQVFDRLFGEFTEALEG